jgi:hypothetical protein
LYPHLFCAVTNNGKIAHEFMIMPIGMHMEHMAMDEMHKIALYMFDNVAPGETKTFNYTFNQSMVGQNFEFACHLPGHKVLWSAHRFLCQNQGETACFIPRMRQPRPWPLQ